MVFWVILEYFNIRNTLVKSGTFLLGHPVYSIHINATFLFPLYKCCLTADHPVANTKHHNFHTVNSVGDDLSIIGFLNV